MSIFNFFRPKGEPTCAAQAKERLQIILAHERVATESPDYLPLLQKELLAVIAKYVQIDEEKVAVKLGRQQNCSTLEVDVELPRGGRVRLGEAVAEASSSPRSAEGKSAEAACDRAEAASDGDPEKVAAKVEAVEA
jgi:cell division topological specificity factor